jgi:hypothetical protein
MTSRRSLLQLICAAAARQLVAETPGSTARPFRVAVPKQTLDRILTRVREARWPDRLEGGWQYGANYDYLKELAAYWTTRYSWRKAEVTSPKTSVSVTRPASKCSRCMPGSSRGHAARRLADRAANSVRCS